jgi:DUF4097 and DUF4098 domain-containing protein YvlB
MEHRRLRHVRLSSLLAALACLAGLPGALACHVDLRAEARDQWTRSYPLSAGGALEIRNTNGRIQVDATDGTTIEVVADRVVNAMDEADAKRALERLTIDEDVTPSRVRLSSTRPTGGQLHVSTRVDYTVRVPKWAAVTLVSTNGDLQISGLEGTLDVRTTNGDVSGRSLLGGTTVETTNGAVELDLAQVPERGVSCETTNGSVTIALPRDAKAHLAARVSNGNISVRGLDVAASEQSRRALEGAIGGGGPLIRTQTTNGSIELRGR